MRAQFEPNGNANSNDFVVQTYETPYSANASLERSDFVGFREIRPIYFSIGFDPPTVHSLNIS